jgi:hypothetical protein
MGPAPMIMIELISVLFGMEDLSKLSATQGV